MLRVTLLSTVVLLTGCARNELELPATLDFDDVSRGAETSRAFVLENTTGRELAVTLSTDTPEFQVSPPAVSLQPAQHVDVVVTFAPSGLGPRTGRLSIGDQSVLVRGQGQGPAVRVSSMVELPLGALVNGAEAIVTSELVVRNVGTAASTLHVRALPGTAPELCVGRFSNGHCEPFAESMISTGAPLVIPLTARLLDERPHEWTVNVESDDVDRPRIEIVIRATARHFGPCAWSGPTAQALGDPSAMVLTHLGSLPCFVRGVMVAGVGPGVIDVAAPTLPLELAPGAALAMSLTQRAFFEGGASIEVEAAGTPPFVVTLSSEQCLRFSVDALDFRAPGLTCAAAEQRVEVINTCARFISVTGLQVEGDFAVTTAPQVLAPFSSAPLSLAFRPLAAGPSRGLVRVGTSWGELVLSVSGMTGAGVEQHDTFREDPPAAADVLVLIDSSPSFVPLRGLTRSNLEAVLRSVEHGCSDLRWAVAPASRDPGLALQVSDGGAQWISNSDPRFVDQVLSAFDGVPVGTEAEACVEPALRLVGNGGVRPNTLLSVVCVTDALEAAGAQSSFTDLQNLTSASTTLSVVCGLGTSSCAVESVDDGTHASLVSRSGGVLGDVCDPSWSRAFIQGNAGCGRRSHYFLSVIPSGPITVSVNGVAVPDTSWSYDASSNSITFAPASVPTQGSTLDLTYRTGC